MQQGAGRARSAYLCWPPAPRAMPATRSGAPCRRPAAARRGYCPGRWSAVCLSGRSQRRAGRCRRDRHGGGCEVVWGTGDDITCAHSFQLGAARLHHNTPSNAAGHRPGLRAGGMLGAFRTHARQMDAGGRHGAALKRALQLPATPARGVAFDRALVSEQLNHMASLTPGACA